MAGKYHPLALPSSVLDNTPLLAQSGFHFRLEIGVDLFAARLVHAAWVVETGSSVSRHGCTVDLKQICKNFFDRPTFTLNGVQYDSQRLQSEAARHMDAVLPYNYPHGDLLAAVNCQLDTQTHRITRADLASGPPSIRKQFNTCTAKACA
jgi:hypothetical protein